MAQLYIIYLYVIVQNYTVETLSPLLKDKLMLSGEEASWRILKEALPALEGLKEKSSILFSSSGGCCCCCVRRKMQRRGYSHVHFRRNCMT